MKACFPSDRTRATLRRPWTPRIHAGVSVALAMLAGCTAVGPEYRQPTLDVPPTWSRGEATKAAVEDHASWWIRFNDPTLTALIEQALSASPDVRSAQARLREARARRDLAQANRAPSLSASASANRSTGSRETGSGATRDLYSAGFDASWELDVFGGRRRALQAAQADLEAGSATLDATRVSLAAEVARNYVELRALQARLAIARNNLASQQETLQLTEWRALAGLVSTLQVEQARTNVEQTRAQIPSLQASLDQAQHRLAILLGRPPGALIERLAAAAPIPAADENIALAIPAEVLRQRPDVHAAERRLAAETARVGQAMAARYPSVNLSAALGLQALTLGALTGGDAATRSLAAGIAAPIFDAGRIRQQIEIQNAVQEQALVNLEAAVLTALKEIEDALSTLAHSRARRAALRDAVAAARSAAELARHRYAAGLVDFQSVLDTQRTVLSVEDSLASTESDRAVALIQLYKALGGGWSAARGAAH